MAQMKVSLNVKHEILTILFPPNHDGQIRDLVYGPAQEDGFGRFLTPILEGQKLVGVAIKPFVLAVDTDELIVDVETIK
jgi:hypothetical protein